MAVPGGPSCTKATDQDANNLNFSPGYTDQCKKTCDNGYFDFWHFNPDQQAQVCIVQGDTRFSGMSPSRGSKQISHQQFTNHLDKEAMQVLTLSGSDGNSLTVSTTNSMNFSQSIAIEVEVPKVMKVTSTTTIGFSSSKTKSQTVSEDRSYSNQLRVPVAPGATVCAVLEVETLSYQSEFEVDVCFEGFMRCQYGVRCNGYYYWYTAVQNLDRTKRCGTIAGRASSNQNVRAEARAYKGACQQDMHLFAEEIKEAEEIAVE